MRFAAWAIRPIVRLRRMTRVLLVTTLFAVGGNFVLAQDKDMVKEHFLANAPQQWREYREFVTRLQGKFTSTIESQGKVTRASTGMVKQNANCRLFMREFSVITDRKDSAAGYGYVWAYNANYSFSLQQKTSQSPWVLGELDTTKGGKKSSSTDYANSVKRILGILISVGPTDLSDLVEQATFRVVNAKKIDHLGRQAVSIEFDNAHPVESKPFNSIQSGTLILDPSRFWCLRACDIETQYSNTKGKVHIESSYRDSKSAYPIPIRVMEKREGMDFETGSQLVGTTLGEFELEDPPALPGDSEFTLTAFGLPEPMGMPPRKPRRRTHLSLDNLGRPRFPGIRRFDVHAATAFFHPRDPEIATS